MSKVIVTHDGAFHADEVMAVSVLKALYKDVSVIRTRDAEITANANPDFIVDVGGEYAPDSGKFDHHQVDESLVRDDGTPYSAVGLVWKSFGRKLLAYYGVKEAFLDAVFERVDFDLIRAIDVIDTGFKLPTPSVPEVHYSLIVGNMNSRNTFNHDAQEVMFNQAVDISMKILESFIYASHDLVLAEEEFHHRAVGGKMSVEMPYGLQLRKLAHRYSSLRCVFYPRGDGNWNVSVVNSKYYFDEQIAGKSPEDINKFFGLTDVVFVHKAGFIAVVGSRESALVLTKYVEEM